MTPLHHRVLIKPDPQPTDTASGLAVVRDYPEPETSGTVIARGHGPAWAQAIRRDTILACQRIAEDVHRHWNIHSGWAELFDRLQAAYAATSLPDPDVPIGARVVFSPASGQVVETAEGRYLLMAEDDVLAVVEPDEDAKEAKVAA